MVHGPPVFIMRLCIKRGSKRGLSHWEPDVVTKNWNPFICFPCFQMNDPLGTGEGDFSTVLGASREPEEGVSLQGVTDHPPPRVLTCSESRVYDSVKDPQT